MACIVRLWSCCQLGVSILEVKVNGGGYFFSRRFSSSDGSPGGSLPRWWMAVQGVACKGGGWQSRSRGGQAWTAAWSQAAAALQWSGGSVSCLKTSTCQLLCLMTSTARVFKERNSYLLIFVKMMSGFTCDTASQCNGI